MKIFFSFLILFILTLEGFSTTYEIKNLNKQNNQSQKILENYLKQTD